ncbi:Transcriptional regulator, TetR family protein [Minicystis rosea]|nr:Transcriptional regulator, TetR family protein [Minicystis rosea]
MARPPSPRSAEESKQRLLEVGKKLFARHGFAGASTRAIAQGAALNISMIRHYFGSKEGLYVACLEDFARARTGVLDHVLTPAANVVEFRARLELAVEETLRFHLADPEALEILMRDMRPGAKLLDPSLEAVFVEFPVRLARYFADGQQRGWLRAGVDPLVPAGLLYFSFAALLQVDFMAKRSMGLTLHDPEQRRLLVTQAVDVVLRGVLDASA